MTLVDSHCHLDFPEFADDLDGVLARAAAAGVGFMTTICTRVKRFDQVLTIAEAHDMVACSVGTHPHNAAEEIDVTVDDLVRLAAHPKVIGIGEAGLDFHYDNSPRDDQRASFRTHIEAARRIGLPLIVHTRSADAETASILRDEMGKGAFKGVLHCFSCSRELAMAGVELGLHVSFSGILTFNKSDDLRAIAADIPMDRLLVETDAPFLAPVPHRGRTNEPAFVRHTAAVLARVKGVSEDEIAARTTANFCALFDKAHMARPC